MLASLEAMMRVDMTLICQRTERRLFPIKAAMLRLPQKAGVIVDSYDRYIENIGSDPEPNCKKNMDAMEQSRAKSRKNAKTRLTSYRDGGHVGRNGSDVRLRGGLSVPQRFHPGTTSMI